MEKACSFAHDQLTIEHVKHLHPSSAISLFGMRKAFIIQWSSMLDFITVIISILFDSTSYLQCKMYTVHCTGSILKLDKFESNYITDYMATCESVYKYKYGHLKMRCFRKLCGVLLYSDLIVFFV